MYCVACGAKLNDGQNFCPSCGKAVAGIPPPAGAPTFAAAYPVAPPLRKDRVATNVRMLGILWMVYSALHLLPGLFLIAFFGEGRTFLPPDVPAFVPFLVECVGGALSAVSLVGFAVGWGLMNWKPWARMLGIVLGVLSLFNLPLGTALGAYTLWVLLPAESEQEYHRSAAAAQSY